MKKAHILLVVRPAMGGIRQHLNSLITGLQDEFVFTIACPLEQIRNYQGLSCQVEGLPILGKFNPLYDYRVMWRLIRIMQSGSFQLIHAHGFKAGFVTRPAARYCKLPCLLTVHSDFAQLKSAELLSVYLKIERFLARWTTEYIAVSKWLSAQLSQKLSIKQECINIVPNGIDVDAIPQNNSKPLTLPCPEEAVLVGTVARLAPQKGLETFIRAAALLSSLFSYVHFVVAGSGPLYAELVQLREEFGLTERLTFLGHCEQVSTLLNKLTVFVLPSLSEAQGIAVLEAMAAGCPVVASATGGLCEIIQDYHNGLLVPPGDAKLLAAAIRSLLLQPQLAARLAKQGQAETARFSQAESLRKTKMIYERVLEGGF